MAVQTLETLSGQKVEGGGRVPEVVVPRFGQGTVMLTGVEGCVEAVARAGNGDVDGCGRMCGGCRGCAGGHT